MCDHTTQEEQLLQLFEDWLLVAHPDAIHDLERHLTATGNEARAADVLNMLSQVNGAQPTRGAS